MVLRMIIVTSYGLMNQKGGSISFQHAQCSAIMAGQRLFHVLCAQETFEATLDPKN